MKIYVPIFHIASSTWLLGVAETHQVRPLTVEEIEYVRNILNAPASQEQSVSGEYKWRPTDGE